MTKKIQDLAKNKQDNTFKKEKHIYKQKGKSKQKIPDTPLFVEGFPQLFNFCHNN